MVMQRSKFRHPLAVLRQICGLGQKEMGLLAACATITIQKIENRGLDLSESLAQRIFHETGVSLAWLLAGDPSAPPLDGAGKPYTSASFEWHRAGGVRTMGVPFTRALQIAAIGSAAGDQGKAALFLWRLGKFFDECAKEFGFDQNAYAIAAARLKKSKLNLVCFHDKGFDMSTLADKRVTAAVANATKEKAPGASFTATVRLPPARQKKRSSRARKRRQE